MLGPEARRRVRAEDLLEARFARKRGRHARGDTGSQEGRSIEARDTRRACGGRDRRRPTLDGRVEERVRESDARDRGRKRRAIREDAAERVDDDEEDSVDAGRERQTQPMRDELHRLDFTMIPLPNQAARIPATSTARPPCARLRAEWAPSA